MPTTNYKYKVDNNSYQEFLIDVEKFFKNGRETIHKARNEIKVVTYNNSRYSIKSFKVPHIINRVAYAFFRDSKAKKSYENGVKISEFTPKVIGYIEFYKFGLLDKSYFISRYFDHDFTIREPLLDSDFIDRDVIFRAFANFTYKLHQKDILHLDYSPGNILIKKDKDEYIFKIVDINRMKFKKLSLDERLKNFNKLWAKDDDLKVIVKEYAKLINEDEESCIKKALFYSQKHKNRKNLKKRLKGERVVD